MNAIIKILGGSAVLAGVAFAAWSALAPASPPPLTDAEQAQVAEARLRPDLLLQDRLVQIYTAFQAEDEAAIYDALAAAARGDVLEELYLQRREALTTRDAAVQEVHDVMLQSMSAEWPDPRAVTFAADWQVLGRVGHDTHTHVRGNAYTADITMTLFEDGFHVTAFDLQDVRRDPSAGELIVLPE
ncbi:hypothetical protein FHS89_000956 [Rubricella aquisinus]|uniref:SnoaL-like domain-containing protein n=1 Tax=Rubricella aquisinus TaxID=2028108 RepID=A0A840WUR5_9RHOB|nr:hypothetical protein [Rubricella aquisinus]MBB5514950.1 hypothetical protein [Rubricella aquisinus]